MLLIQSAFARLTSMTTLDCSFDHRALASAKSPTLMGSLVLAAFATREPCPPPPHGPQRLCGRQRAVRGPSGYLLNVRVRRSVSRPSLTTFSGHCSTVILFFSRTRIGIESHIRKATTAALSRQRKASAKSRAILPSGPRLARLRPPPPAWTNGTGSATQPQPQPPKTLSSCHVELLRFRLRRC